MTHHHSSGIVRLGISLLVTAGMGAGCGSSKSSGTAIVTGGAPASNGGTASNTGGASAPTGGDVSDTGGAQGSTGGDSSTASGGTSSAAGGGTNTGGTDPCAAKPACTSPTTCTPVAPTNALITDWVDVCMTTGATGCLGQFVDNDTFSAPGSNWWTKFYGGIYVYPAIDPKGCTVAPQYPLTQTVAPHAWHITGTVGDYSGFGIWFAPCMADMSAYTGGISITVSGSVATLNTLNVSVASSSNLAHAPTNCNANVGTCSDTTCKSATKTVLLSQTPTVVKIAWTDFIGGSPDFSPNPSEITGLSFNLPDPYTYSAASKTATPYAVERHHRRYQLVLGVLAILTVGLQIVENQRPSVSRSREIHRPVKGSMTLASFNLIVVVLPSSSPSGQPKGDLESLT